MLSRLRAFLALCLSIHVLSVEGKCTAKVKSLSPAFGRFDGGVRVNVTGKDFVNYGNVKCRFGIRLMVGTVLGQDMITCIAPANIEAERPRKALPLEITLNGVDFTTSAVKFTYYDINLIKISLLTPDGGPIAGGTVVTVHGSNFFNTKHLNCTWDHNADLTLTVPATFLSFYKMTCVSPRIPKTVAKNVRQSLDLSFDDYHYTSLNKTWNYYDPADLSVYSLHPTGGPSAGGTTVDLIGEGFIKMGGYLTDASCVSGTCLTDTGTYCKFEHADLTQATWVTNNRMKCITPKYTDTLTNNAAVVTIEVTINGDVNAVTTTVANWTYYDPREARLQYMDTMGGPSYADTLVTIVGKLFYDFQGLGDHALKCRFGWVGHTNATRIDATKVKCYSPTIYGTGRFQTVDLDITMNDQDYTTNGLDFTYYRMNTYQVKGANYTGVNVNRLQPYGGPKTGATMVTVRGNFFHQYGNRDFALAKTETYELTRPILCKFGNLKPVAATFINTTAIRCASPNCANSGSYTCAVAATKFLEVPVEVSINNQLNSLTDSNIKFTYYGVDVLQVSWIYPQAGPKAGGNTVTVFGSGFKTLGRTDAGLKCRFGTSNLVEATIIGKYAANGILPTQLTCTSPAYGDADCDTPQQVCVDITNNNDTAALTRDCARFTYYDG